MQAWIPIPWRGGNPRQDAVLRADETLLAAFERLCAQIKTPFDRGIDALQAQFCLESLVERLTPMDEAVLQGPTVGLLNARLAQAPSGGMYLSLEGRGLKAHLDWMQQFHDRPVPSAATEPPKGARASASKRRSGPKASGRATQPAEARRTDRAARATQSAPSSSESAAFMTGDSKVLSDCVPYARGLSGKQRRVHYLSADPLREIFKKVCSEVKSYPWHALTLLMARAVAGGVSQFFDPIFSQEWAGLDGGLQLIHGRAGGYGLGIFAFGGRVRQEGSRPAKAENDAARRTFWFHNLSFLLNGLNWGVQLDGKEIVVTGCAGVLEEPLAVCKFPPGHASTALQTREPTAGRRRARARAGAGP